MNLTESSRFELVTSTSQLTISHNYTGDSLERMSFDILSGSPSLYQLDGKEMVQVGAEERTDLIFRTGLARVEVSADESEVAVVAWKANITVSSPPLWPYFISL